MKLFKEWYIVLAIVLSVLGIARVSVMITNKLSKQQNEEISNRIVDSSVNEIKLKLRCAELEDEYEKLYTSYLKVVDAAKASQKHVEYLLEQDSSTMSMLELESVEKWKLQDKVDSLQTIVYELLPEDYFKQ